MTLKVLSVDDSKTIRMIVKKAFKPFDCEVFEAENGQEGLALAGKVLPDLIVLDITMPVMTGVEMLEKLKADPALRSIPVIMLTAESGKDNVMNIVKMGVQNYIVKPFKGEQLIERAQTVIKLEAKAEEGGEGDASARYFALDGNVQVITLPAKIIRPVAVEVETLLKAKVEEMKKGAVNRCILNLTGVTETNVSLIKLIITVLETCQRSSIHIRVVGTSALAAELKSFQETSEIPIRMTLEEAKGSF
jgi:CheY-like chemotaxis protein/anti-anti-sigma regulatory factor